MYKFFVKCNNTAKEIWVPYMEDIVTITPGKTVINEEGNETTEPDTKVSEYKEWTTDDLAVLAEKYKLTGENDTMLVNEFKEWELKDDTVQDILHLIDNNFKCM